MNTCEVVSLVELLGSVLIEVCLNNPKTHAKIPSPSPREWSLASGLQWDFCWSGEKKVFAGLLSQFIFVCECSSFFASYSVPGSWHIFVQ